MHGTYNSKYILYDMFFAYSTVNGYESMLEPYVFYERPFACHSWCLLDITSKLIILIINMYFIFFFSHLFVEVSGKASSTPSSGGIFIFKAIINQWMCLLHTHEVESVLVFWFISKFYKAWCTGV